MIARPEKRKSWTVPVVMGDTESNAIDIRHARRGALLTGDGSALDDEDVEYLVGTSRDGPFGLCQTAVGSVRMTENDIVAMPSEVFTSGFVKVYVAGGVSSAGRDVIRMCLKS